MEIRRTTAAVLWCAFALGLLSAGPAGAADSIYWANYSSNTIGVTSTDGSVPGANLYTTPTTPLSQPSGIALDPAANRIYWANSGDGTIRYSNLDGTGSPATLTMPGATVSAPRGLAIDPGAGKIYWANAGTDGLMYANLDGSGGGPISTAGSATFDTPYGPAIDPAANKIYWGNYNNGVNIGVGVAVSYTNLDSTGSSANLTTTPSGPVNGPSSIALDKAAGKAYWTNNALTTFGMADLAPGGNGAVLSQTGGAVSNPVGLALDPGANRFYWVNGTGGTPLSYSNLDGTGMGGNLSIGAATVSDPNWIVLLKKPVGTGAPVVSGASASGSGLTCTGGTWADNVVGAQLMRAPRTVTTQWTLNGADLPGATSGTMTATAGGSYACRLTAANQAGSTSQTSAPHSVSAPATPTAKKTCKKGFKLKKVKGKLKCKRKKKK